MGKFCRLLLIIAAFLPALVGQPLAAWGQDFDPALVAVQIEKPAGNGKQFAHGSGVSLGYGLILTAAHVVQINPSDPNVKVLMDGILLSGRVMKADRPEIRDLALIQVEQSQLPARRQQQKPLNICPENPGLLQPVIVAAQGKISQAHTINSPITSWKEQTSGWTNLLSTGFDHGTSGGGIFLPGRDCLSGIVFLRLSGPDTVRGGFLDLTAFVPPSQITAFLYGLP